MLQVTDFRQTRVFQEALEEGIEKGIEMGIEKGIEMGIEMAIKTAALRLLAMDRPFEEIAQATDLTPAQIRKLRKQCQK